MQACEGYVENGQFHPLSKITQSQEKVRAILMILDEPAKQSNTVNNKAFWAEFDRMAAESSDENNLLSDEAFARQPSGRELITLEDEE
jgi:hypothetical protein